MVEYQSHRLCWKTENERVVLTKDSGHAAEKAKSVAFLLLEWSHIFWNMHSSEQEAIQDRIVDQNMERGDDAEHREDRSLCADGQASKNRDWDHAC